MLRWTLHKKVQNNPANSLSLVWVLIKELEKVFDFSIHSSGNISSEYLIISPDIVCFLHQAERWDSRRFIIPLLHTLMYAIIQVQRSCHIVASDVLVLTL